MKLLMMPPYFFPEQMASSHLDNDRFEAYSKAGFDVSVITPKPTRGVSKETRKMTARKENMYGGKVHVYRFSLFREGKNPIFRAVRYVLQNFKQAYLGTKVSGVDVIYSGSTPPTQGLLCGYVKKKLIKKEKKYIPFVFCLQDIFPDSAVNTGLIKYGSILWKIGRKIENYTYSQADKIIVISDGFKRNIIKKGVPEDKIIVVSNWVDLNQIKPVLRKDNTLINEFSINANSFIIVYAGNLGDAQGSDIIIKVAKEMQDYPKINFVIFGGGKNFDRINNLIIHDDLKNVKLLPLQPQERVSEVYSLGDIALITCKPGMGYSAMPSKTWSIMACNTPILASYDLQSDLSDVLKSANAGKCVLPGKVEELKNSIIDYYHLWEDGGYLSSEAREYALFYASKEKCVSKYVEVLSGQYKSNYEEGKR